MLLNFPCMKFNEDDYVTVPLFCEISTVWYTGKQMCYKEVLNAL